MSHQDVELSLINELVELKVQYQPHCVVEFSVKASPALVKKAHQEAIKSVAKDTTLPGFRKGKAPDAIIVKNFSSAVDKAWQQKIAEQAFRESEKLAQIPVLNSDTKVGFTMVRHSLEDGAEMSFHFETEPKTPDVDLEALSLKKEPYQEVSQDAIDETLRKIRLFFATWEPVVNRPVQSGDFIVVDLDALEESGPVRVFTEARLEVSEATMAQWMRDIVIGMESEETREGISEPDATASAEDKERFQPKKVRVFVQFIEEPVLPVVDDDFARTVGADSASILMDRLRTLLQKQEDKTQRDKYRDELTHLLLEKYSFDIPQSLLHKEVQHRVGRFVKNPQFKKLTEEERKEELENIKKQAEEALRLFYLCKKVAIDHNLVISASDLEAPVETPLDAMFADRELSNPNKTEEQKNLLMSRMLLEKAQDFLIDKLLG